MVLLGADGTFNFISFQLSPFRQVNGKVGVRMKLCFLVPLALAQL